MKRIIISSRELVGAKAPTKPVTYLGTSLIISKSKYPYSMYVEYSNAGSVLSPTAEWKVLVEIGYKAKGSKSWKTKHATIEGAPGQVWQDNSKGSLAKALADINVDLGNIIDQNTINKYFTDITQVWVPTVEIKQSIEDPRAWKSETNQRNRQVQQQLQQQKTQKQSKPANGVSKAISPVAPVQSDDEDDDRFSSVNDFKEKDAYSPRKSMTYNDVLSDRRMGPHVNRQASNLNANDSFSDQEKYFMIKKDKDSSGQEYLIFEGPNKKILAISAEGAKNLFRKSKSTQVDMDSSYRSYEQTRKEASNASNNDPNKTFNTVGYDMYNLFIPYKIKGGIALGPDEWVAIRKGEITKNAPYFSGILSDEKNFSASMSLLKNFRSAIASGKMPTSSEENALKTLNMHEIFDDVWDYFEEGGKEKILSKVQPKTPAAKPPAQTIQSPSTQDPKNNITSSADDEDIITKFADVIFKEDKK